MQNTNDIMQQLQQSKHKHDMRNYSGRIKEATQALQRAIQAINKIIRDITSEETFVEQIHNQMTVDDFMSTVMNTIHTELPGCAAHLNFSCPSHLDLLAAKQKALQDIYQSIADIQELLALHRDLYGICNYGENYRIYQILHAFFKQIENDCLTLATSVTEADIKAWLETQPATHRQFITALQKIEESFINRYAAREQFATLSNDARDVTPMVSTPTATPLTTSTSQIPTAESTAVEPQSVLTGDTLPATTGIANLVSTADPALNTGLESFTALPQELLLEIAKRLDANSLLALALTGKTQAKRLLTLIERELKKSTVQITAQPNRTFLFTSHQLLGCGVNDIGQLGLGHANSVTQFTPIPGLTGQILQVAAGKEHTLVLTTEGLFGHGNRLAIGLAARTHRDFSFTIIPNLPGEILQIITGSDHSLVLTTDGLFGCGGNSYGQLGLGHTKRVTQFTPIPGLTGKILQVVAGSGHIFVLTSEGLFGCGSNQFGQLGLGHTNGLGYSNDVTQFTQITKLPGQILQVIARGYHTFILTSEGLFGCGLNNIGQLGLGHTNNVIQFTPIPGLTGQILQVITAGSRIFVLTTKGLFGCGTDYNGVLGLGDTKRANRQFTPIPGLTGEILQIAAGDEHTLVLTSEGLFGCGQNDGGKLGLGDTKRVTQFTPIPGLTGQILQVAAEDDHTLVLTSEGLFGCGRNDSGQLGSPNNKQIRCLTLIQDKNINAFFSLQLSLQRKWHLLQTIAKDALIQIYLQPANTNTTESIESQRQAALAQLQIDIVGIKSLLTLYDLFVQVTQAKTSVLRLRRKNILVTYEDTASYRLAIQALAENALTFQSACNSFAQYTQLQTMLQEALRCNAPGQDWKERLITLKSAALEQLLQDIQQATDLNQLLALFQALIEPNNLLRFNPSAIFHDYDDTAEYKTALLQLGQQMEEYTFTKQALPELYSLLEHLHKIKPSVNVKWQHTIEELENKLHAVQETIGVVQAAALPSPRAAKP